MSTPGSATTPDLVATTGNDARRDPVRLLVLQGEARPAVHVEDEPMVMTFPHLLLRELIALLGISIVLVVASLLFDAPLEELANPEKTPNPAKAPWYFLGLQELLHYYPPLVSGVVLPGLVFLALAVIPYVEINLRREALWAHGTASEVAARQRRTLLGLWSAVLALTAVFLFAGAHPVWAIIVPLWVVAIAMSIPAFAGTAPTGFPAWLGERSLAFWVFLWFLIVAVTLTAIGVFFRGPGWSLTLPWRDGLFY